MSDRKTAILDDMELLRQYADTGSEAAFAQLVQRHLDWVFSVCHRGVRDRHLAEDVTQSVFLLLARKAKTMPEATILRGWLFKTARFAVSDAIKKRARAKKHHDRAAAQMPAQIVDEQEQTWDRVSPVLDEAVACLGSKDRQAIMLRFYDGKSLAEVGLAMGISEEAAKKRVARAVEKLRTLFSRQGIVLPAALLFGLLLSNPAQAAPAGLASQTLAIATGQLAASSLVHAIAHGTLQAMIRATHRLLAVMAAGAASLAVVAGLGISAMLGGPSSIQWAHVAPHATLPPVQAEIPQADLSSLAHVWIGSHDGVLFDYKEGQAPRKDLLELADREPAKPLYAVVRDRSGQFWSKPLNLAPFASPGDGYEPPILSIVGPSIRRDTAGLLALMLGDNPPSREMVFLPPPGASGPREPLPSLQLDSPWTPLRGAADHGSALVSDSPIPGIHLQNHSSPNPFNFVVPVPEPATLGLCLAAASLLALRRRRSR